MVREARNDIINRYFGAEKCLHSKSFPAPEPHWGCSKHARRPPNLKNLNPLDAQGNIFEIFPEIQNYTYHFHPCIKGVSMEGGRGGGVVFKPTSNFSIRDYKALLVFIF